MVLGVVGTFASGKDTVAEYLATKGFRHISTANTIRAMMQTQGLSLDRDTITRFATETRAREGNAYFTKQSMVGVTDEAVFADMRHPDEIDSLRQRYGNNFLLVSVDAPIELRYQRACSRGRVGDGETLEDFRAKEDREMSGRLGSHYLKEVIRQADIRIQNDGTLAELHAKVDRIISQPKGKTAT